VGHCSLCSKAFFVLVEGKIVSATTPEKLLEKIYRRIDKLNIEQEAWLEDLS